LQKADKPAKCVQTLTWRAQKRQAILEPKRKRQKANTHFKKQPAQVARNNKKTLQIAKLLQS